MNHLKIYPFFFTKYNNKRNDYISENIESFTSKEYENVINEYDTILDKWEKELREDINNYLFDDELELFTRLKYDNKKIDSKIRGDIDEILYFLKYFKVPSTNNNAESSQRDVKIKQKIGKFRSLEGTDSYLNIKSCILSYKKQGIDILETIISAFANEPIIS